MPQLVVTAPSFEPYHAYPPCSYFPVTFADFLEALCRAYSNLIFKPLNSCLVSPSRSYSSVTFTDFLEALCRVADYKFLPTQEELDVMEYPDVLAWAIDYEKYQGIEGEEAASIPEIFKCVLLQALSAGLLCRLPVCCLVRLQH